MIYPRAAASAEAAALPAPLPKSFMRSSDSPPQIGDTLTTPEGHTVELYAQARLPTRWGEFTLVAFKNSKDPHEHVALTRGALWGAAEVPTRLHSECVTGDVFHSLKCDCGDQLDLAMQELSQRERGILLYMRQEGRGIGLANKVRAYALQEQGLDTVQANAHLGFDDDLREYDVAAAMLHLLGVASIDLYTNNPAKIAGLERGGVRIAARRPLQASPNAHNHSYLATKRLKSGHLL